MRFRRAGTWLGLVDEEDDSSVDDAYDDEYDDEDPADGEPVDEEAPSGQIAHGEGFQIAMVRARNFRDAATVGEYFRQNIPVIINLEGMELEDARRIVDFASGLILGRRGDIERLSQRIFLILPADTTIRVPQDKLTDEGFFNQD